MDPFEPRASVDVGAVIGLAVEGMKCQPVFSLRRNRNSSKTSPQAHACKTALSVRTPSRSKRQALVMAGRPSICGVTGTGDSHGTGRTPATFARLASTFAVSCRSCASSRRRRASSGPGNRRSAALRARWALSSASCQCELVVSSSSLCQGLAVASSAGVSFRGAGGRKSPGALPLSLLISGAVGVETLIVITVSNCRPAPASAVAARPLRVATDSRALRSFPQVV